MPRVLRNHYVLAVPDAEVSAEFFVQALGFRAVPVADPGWRFVEKDDCLVMLGSCPAALAPAELGEHSYFGYLVVDDVDAYFEELKRKKVDLLSEVSDKPWKMREFGIRTPDGHRIMIGQAMR